MAESFSAVYARLQAAQKGRARGAPAYSVYVNRPLGRVFATVAYRAGLTPNQVTGVSALFTFSGIALVALAPVSPATGIGVWLLLAVGYAWDSADGQVARLRGGGSLAGEWLDHFVDALKISSLHIAILIGLARTGEIAEVWMLVPLMFTIIANVSFFGMILNDLLRAKKGVAAAAAAGGGSFWRSIVKLPTDYGLLCLVMVLWAWPAAFLAAYTAIAVANALFLALAAVSWFRSVRALDEL
ncbi:MAG: CDP-alcohol phosphatidyltransferase family protein [Microbacterium sp.]